MSEKITRFRDIPQFTRKGHWECDFSFDDMIEKIDRWVVDLKLDLDPDFQRGHVWDEEHQVNYLEFFFRGGTTGRVLYFNHPGWSNGTYEGDFVIVDGKQRLQAFRRFVNNEIKVYGSYFREYTDQPHMIHHSVKMNVNNLQTRREVLQWYLEMNTGGVVHTPSEIAKVRWLLEQEEKNGTKAEVPVREPGQRKRAGRKGNDSKAG